MKKGLIIIAIFAIVGIVLGCTVFTTEEQVVDRVVDTGVVYITATGKCYHYKGCRFVTYSSTAISISQARSKGYRACNVCGGYTDKDYHYKSQTEKHPVKGGIWGGLTGTVMVIAIHIIQVNKKRT